MQITAGSGAGISLMAESGTRQAVCASDPLTEHIEEQQFVLGEGPCVDAFQMRRPVLVPELDGTARGRWPAYTAAAYRAGVRAVFAFPLQVGAARLGVLDVFRSSTGNLARAEVAGALTLADLAVVLLLDNQAHASDGNDGLAVLVGRRAEMFQAQGMVMVQLGVSLDDALARIRAYAFAAGRRVDDVAADIVARRLSLGPPAVPPGDEPHEEPHSEQ